MKRRVSVGRSLLPNNLFRDEQGFTTVSMVLSLLIALSLVFSSAQVYRINAASSQVQDAADAAALAAGNQVSDFVLSVRLCDAVVLSLSLTSLVSYGAGVVALCVPGAQALGDSLIELGGRVAKARDAFAGQAKDSLERYQKALPFLAAARASAVASANDATQEGARYVGAAILVPGRGDFLDFSLSSESSIGEEIEENADDLKKDAAAAEEAAKAANAIKERAFMRDCGDFPGYCLYERADKLAGLGGSDNPFYSSVDAWSFSVPLERARSYYAKRLSIEAPADDSVPEQARSALRTRFYEYAIKELESAYVVEGGDRFDAYLPVFPKNTDEMRDTWLFSEVAYPITADGDGLTMHAWPGCPLAAGFSSLGSIEQMEEGDFNTCPKCEFTASSMGSVASASTAIENGFEYHYAAIAEAAGDYKEARNQVDPLSKKVKDSAGGLIDAIMEEARKAAGARLSPNPPGGIGAIAFVANVGSVPEGFGFSNSFVSPDGNLGTRVAVSGSTLLQEPSDEGRNAITSLLDGFKENGGLGGAGLALGAWSATLDAYANGQSALLDAVERVLGSLPLVGASGLGPWASSKFKECMSAVGLEPAEVESLKPVLVNTGHVASTSSDEAAGRYLSVKMRVLQNPPSSTDAFSSVLNGVESYVEEGVLGMDSIKIAEIELGAGGPPFVIEVPLPDSVKGSAQSVIQSVFSRLRDIYLQVSGVRAWE